MRSQTSSSRGEIGPDRTTGAMTNPKKKNEEKMQDCSGRSSGHCLICGSGDVWTFVEMHGVPVHSNVLLLSYSEALSVSRGDLEMKCCRDCGHVFNTSFSFEKTKYSSDYENSLFFSETFRAYASSLASELIDRFDLHGRRVMEIGCGSGDFLKLLCEKGENDGIGFDPSALAGRSINQHPRINFIRDYYLPKHARLGADFLCCRHVLEHAESPQKFIRDIKEGLPTGKKVGLFFEVPDVNFILKEHSSWDFIYEHNSYFSMSSLGRLFSNCGFTVLDIWQSFHAQFICVCAETRNGKGVKNGTSSDLDKNDVLKNAEIFSQVFQKQVWVWKERFRLLEKSKVVLWGAGSKGVTFLNVFQGKNPIRYVVDINKQKSGKYIPGTGQKIVSPDFLREYKPDAVILMNPAYEAEVRKVINKMRISPRVIQVNQPAGGGRDIS